MTVPHGLKHRCKTRLRFTDYTEKLISLVGLQSYKIDKLYKTFLESDAFNFAHV